MTIETSSAQSTSRPAAAESKQAKGKPGDAQSHGAGGFMAILESLDTSDLAAPVAGLPADGALPGNGLVSTALGVLARAAGKLKGAPQPGDASEAIDPSATEENPGKLLPTATTDLTTALPASGDSSLAPFQPLDTSALLAQAAQWPATAVPASNTEPANSIGAAGVAANFAGAAKLPHLQPKSDNAAVASDVGTEIAGKVGKAQKDAFARLASAQTALAAPAATSSQATDTRQAQLLQKVAEIPMTPITQALAAANAVAPARREESTRERSIFRANASDNASSVSQSSYAPSVSGGSGPGAVDPVTSTDTYVAEQVAYWISNDVQNAEMKLDGIGEKPVEVSIRMQGNEAHIAFRSDELQARAALENASVHLKDMLQREGLVLSGVSVGTAGTGDPGGQGSKSRQGARQSGVASVQPARAQRMSVSGRVSGGALDLFV